MTLEDLQELRERLDEETNLVDEMARLQSEGLARLREHFVHEEFVALVTGKREAMQTLAEGREAMRPLSERWVAERTAVGLTDPDVEEALERLRSAFEALREAEEALEALATAYISRLAPQGESVEERIFLHQSWT